LTGTYEALPKGALIPRRRELEVRIGPPVTLDQLRARAAGLARSESYRAATQLAEESMRALKDGRVLPPPPPAGGGSGAAAPPGKSARGGGHKRSAKMKSRGGGGES